MMRLTGWELYEHHRISSCYGSPLHLTRKHSILRWKYAFCIGCWGQKNIVENSVYLKTCNNKTHASGVSSKRLCQDAFVLKFAMFPVKVFYFVFVQLQSLISSVFLNASCFISWTSLSKSGIWLEANTAYSI